MDARVRAFGPGTLASVVVGVFLAIYAGDAGLGLVRDDFAWTAATRHDDGSLHVGGIVSPAAGLYRPLTAASFAVDHALYGLNARGFGLTNLGLALVAAGAVGIVALELGVGLSWAIGASAVWLFNFHGIGNAVLWLSGRSTLLLTAFLLLSVFARLRGRYAISLLLAAAAMLAHEQAVTFPAIMTMWWLVDDRQKDRGRRASQWYLAGLWMVLGAYMALRAGTGAAWFDAAAALPQVDSFPAVLGRNLVEYADRTMTATLLVLALTAGLARRWPRLTREHAHIMTFGVLWLVWGLILVLPLPQRSSLFAVAPSAGVAIAGAAFGQALTRDLDVRWTVRAQLAMLLILLALVPVHWARNRRWPAEARLSADAVNGVRDRAKTAAEHETLWVVDDSSGPSNLNQVWGAHTADIQRLIVGDRQTLVVSRDRADCAHPCAITRWHDGRLDDWQALPSSTMSSSQIRRLLWAELQPVTLTNCTLKRYGEAHDGGYLLCDNLLGDVKAGYSYGISGYDGWGCGVSSLHEVPVHQYDCFNTTVPVCQANTVFHAECVGPKTERIEGRPFDTVENQIAASGHGSSHVVIKMDVEGAEWDSLLAMPDSVLSRVDQLIMEFHENNEDKYLRTVRRLKEFFHVVNLHMNNHACVGNQEPFPAWAYEVLFVSKRLGRVAEGVLPSRTYSALDMPNTPKNPDCQAR